MITINNRIEQHMRFYATDPGKLMRDQEEARQANIARGMAQINAIFGGGSYGVNPVKTYQPMGGTGVPGHGPFGHPRPAAGAPAYYNAEGQPFVFDAGSTGFLNFLKANPGLSSIRGVTPTGGTVTGKGGGFLTGFDRTGKFGGSGGTGGGGSASGANAALLERQRTEYMKDLVAKGLLFSGTTSSPGFNDDFYNKRKAAYESFALPQLAQQAADQQQQLTYKLADQGILQSDAAGRAATSLDQETARQRQGIADQGVQMAQDLRANVENKRSALVSQLQASADPAATGQLALQAGSQFQAPSVYAPLGNLFSQWGQQYLARQQAQAYAPSIAYGNQLASVGGGYTPAVGASYSVRR